MDHAPGFAPKFGRTKVAMRAQDGKAAEADDFRHSFDCFQHEW